jgi:hypothetical protein
VSRKRHRRRSLAERRESTRDRRNNRSSPTRRCKRYLECGVGRNIPNLPQIGHYTHLAACYHLLHGAGIIHGRVLRACAAPCAGIYTHPFQHQRGVNRTHTDRLFRVVCTEPKQLSFVGQRLFSPALSRICQVISTFWHRESKGEGIRCNKTLAFYRDGCRAL